MIIAAEASSSLYAERLLQLWSQQKKEVQAFGVGSRAMEKLGFECIGRSEEMAVVGIQEVIAHWPLIKKTYYDLLEQAKIRKPEFVLLLDYPEFNLRLAKDLKNLGIKVVYYISPQIWAWRTGRVKKMQKFIDHMMVIFPFEKEFYEKNNVPVDFVGHPLLDEMNPDLFDPQWIAAKKQKFGMQVHDQVLALMPGSRRSEIKHHLKTQLEAAYLLQQKFPDLKIVLLLAPTLVRDQLDPVIQEFLKTKDLNFQIIQDEPMTMIAISDYVICASGTATLMVGLLHKPMVIMYQMNPITAFLAKMLVNKTPYFGMANLILNEMAVPELFQEKASPQDLFREIAKMLEDSNYKNQMKEKLSQLQNRLGSKGATQKLSEILWNQFFNKNESKPV